MKDGQNILQLAIPLNANVERFFPWCCHKPKRKRNLSNWTNFYSITAGVQFKISFMQLFL